MNKQITSILSVALLLSALGVVGSSPAIAAPGDTPVFDTRVGVASVRTVESVGSKLWAVGVQDDTVYVYDKTTNALDKTIPLPACAASTLVTTVDAKSLWVQCSAGTVIFRVDLATSAVSTIAIGDLVNHIYSDGTTVWVSGYNNKVYRVSASTGELLPNPVRVPATASGRGPTAVISDGAKAWILYELGSKLMQVDAITGAVIGNPLDSGMWPVSYAYSLTSFGELFSLTGAGIVQQRNFSDGTLVRTINVPIKNSGVSFAVSNGATLWVTLSSSVFFYQYDTSSFVEGINPTPEATVTGTGGHWRGVAEGSNLWLTDFDGLLKKYTVYPRPFAPSAPSAPTVVAGVESASLTWTEPTSGTAPFVYTIISEPTGPSCVVTNLAAACTRLAKGVSYKFKVKATNSSGSADSAQSEPIVAIAGNPDVAPVEGDGDAAPKGVPSGGVKKFVPTNDSTFQLAWDKKAGKLISRATGIYTGYIQAVATFTVAGKTHTCSAVFGTLKVMPMKTAAQKAAAVKSKTFTGKQFCIDRIKMDAKSLAPKGGMTTTNFKKIKSTSKSSSELAKEKLALAALKNFTGEVQIQVTRYRAWPTTMVNLGAHNSKGGKIPFLVRNTKVTLG